MSLFGDFIAQTSELELHFNVESEDGDGYLTLEKVLPDAPVPWCAMCGTDAATRLCDSCCAKEEYSCCGTDFLPSELLHGYERDGTLVVRGRFTYTRDYWGEHDMEFDVSAHAFTPAP